MVEKLAERNLMQSVFCRIDVLISISSYSGKALELHGTHPPIQHRVAATSFVNRILFTHYRCVICVIHNKQTIF